MGPLRQGKRLGDSISGPEIRDGMPAGPWRRRRALRNRLAHNRNGRSRRHRRGCRPGARAYPGDAGSGARHSGVVDPPGHRRRAQPARRAPVHVADVAALRATANPKAATVTGNVNPRTGLDAKFSLTHGVAVALTAPTPQLAHFTDAAAVDSSRRQQQGHPRTRCRTTTCRRSSPTMPPHGSVPNAPRSS
jgi:hypothetical protein